MTDHTHIPDTPEDDEISLLDLLQTIVDSLRLLIISPLVVGLAALGISFRYRLTTPPGSNFSGRSTTGHSAKAKPMIC